MSSVFLALGLRRSMAAFRVSPIVKCTPARTFTTRKITFSLPESRVLNRLYRRGANHQLAAPKPAAGSKSLFTSAKRSVRYSAPPPPPRPSFRPFGFLDRIPPNVVLYGIIGLNAAVFTMWLMAKQKYVRSLIWPFQAMCVTSGVSTNTESRP